MLVLEIFTRRSLLPMKIFNKALSRTLLIWMMIHSYFLQASEMTSELNSEEKASVSLASKNNTVEAIIPSTLFAASVLESSVLAFNWCKSQAFKVFEPSSCLDRFFRKELARRGCLFSQLNLSSGTGVSVWPPFLRAHLWGPFRSPFEQN